jgi:serine-type D-Ala-D-Ala carboxypeptidase/endopeptidase (penicillin-binding protein 4)
LEPFVPRLLPFPTLLALLLAVAPAAAAAPAKPPPAKSSLTNAQLRSALDRQMNRTSRSSGAIVVDLADGRTLYERRAGTPRIPASVQKLATTSAALKRFGPDARLATTVSGNAAIEPGGIHRGDLYLRGAGDPTFGSDAYVQRQYGGQGGRVSGLARALAGDAGIRRVEGRIVADESYFDALRGGATSAVSRWVGPIGALTFDRRLAPPARGASGRGRLAADRLAAALRSRGVTITRGVADGATLAGATELARVESPPMAFLALLANRPSDNFLSEMLLKGIGARFGGSGATRAGASVVARELRAMRATWRVADGSGLSRRNRVTPRQVVRVLRSMRTSEGGTAFVNSLPVAARNGTLRMRMRGTPAAGRCAAKTGSLSRVSTLAGYCRGDNGREVAFAFMMNGAWVPGARAAQDRMTAAVARYAVTRPAGGGATSTR